MEWNWQCEAWPHFTWNADAIKPLEVRFLHRSGVLIGTAEHISADDRQQLIVERMTGEVLKSSEIEGEYLNRDSVQSSIRKQFGLDSEVRRVLPAEQGIAEMMIDLYQRYAEPLTHNTLAHWHELLMQGRRDLNVVGAYRTHGDPMQVVSGPLHKPKVHFEAPPSHEVMAQIESFITWFNQTAPDGGKALNAVTRAGLAHLYFVCIHPFEDGNGRIARAITEKVLSQELGQPTLIALSHTLQKQRKAYYNALEANNKHMDISDWLVRFGEMILSAQDDSQQRVSFLIAKTKLYDRIRGQLNKRQDKVLSRMFREGPEGFTGGLSAENYLSLTSTSRATATRDLNAMVEMGALVKKGELKGTRYFLKLT